ncbi:nuclear transport factor 2 family protein [Nocardia yamanashiensis]|uniref:nuclear transport factor 2 family protein n=1 Tax=Nocardia yamanashiensis TaxID=209247 RepID=UPI000836B5AF|nr:nuclear transport factor 2 family protein [Nocardia yamanashiensis]
MSTPNSEEAQPKSGFTVANWEAFWSHPDLARAGHFATPDILGDWPGDPAPVRGPDAYRARIQQVVDQVPDIRLVAAEHAVNGDVIFIRWIARGTGVNGPFEMDGIDRILLQDGLIKENIIRFDPGRFAELVLGNKRTGED